MGCAARAARGCCRRRRRPRRRRGRSAAARWQCRRAASTPRWRLRRTPLRARAPRATSSATRRNAACSSASARSSVRACAAEIAVLASSAKSAVEMRVSIARGSGSSRATTTSAPHSRPRGGSGPRRWRRTRTRGHLRPLARHLRQVVDPGRATGPPDALDGAIAAPGRAHPDGDVAGSAIERDDLGRAVGLEAQQRREIDAGEVQTPGPRRLRARRPRAPPAASSATRAQRGLLVGERLEVGARLAVRQRRGDELGELLQAILGAGRQRRGVWRSR